MRCLLLLALLTGVVLALNKQQIKGMKKLLKNLDGIYPTCNLVLFSDMVDFDTADKNCKDFNIGGSTSKMHQGNLATVSDEDKNTDLKLVLGMAYPENLDDEWADDQWVWSGLRKVRNLDPEIDESARRKPYNPSDWEWADGTTPGEYDNWLPRQPDQQIGKHGTQYQMRINHAGGWDDTYKSKTHPYACDYQGKYILSATPQTWHMAKKGCEDAGLIFAKVRSDAEAEEMKIAAAHFLGSIDKELRTFDPDNWIWIGGSDADKEGSWIWVADGTPNEYAEDMDWRPIKHKKFQPDHASRLKGSVQHYLSISKWGQFDDSYDHKKRQRPFACQCPGT